MDLNKFGQGPVKPFEAVLVAGDGETVIGRVHGTFDPSRMSMGFFHQMSQYQDDDPRLVVLVVGLVEKMLVSWDLEDESAPAKFERIWDLPAPVSAQICHAVFAAMGNQPPSCMKGMV